MAAAERAGGGFERISHAHRNGRHLDAEGLVQTDGQRGAVHGGHSRLRQHEPYERPVRIQRPAEAGLEEQAEIGRRVRMVGGELRQVVVPPRLPAFEQRAGPRLVHLRVVQHDQTRVAEEVAPHVVVALRVAEVVDRQIVGLTPVHPDELPRGDHPGGVAAGRLGEHVHVQAVPAQERQQFGRVGGDAGCRGRHRAEPGQPQRGRRGVALGISHGSGPGLDGRENHVGEATSNRA